MPAEFEVDVATGPSKDEATAAANARSSKGDTVGNVIATDAMTTTAVFEGRTGGLGGDLWAGGGLGGGGGEGGLRESGGDGGANGAPGG